MSSPTPKIKTRALLGALTSGTFSAAITGLAFSAIFPAAELEKQRAIRLSVLSMLLIASFLIGLSVGWTASNAGRISAVWKKFFLYLAGFFLLALYSGMPWVAIFTALALVGGSTFIGALMAIGLSRLFDRTNVGNSK